MKQMIRHTHLILILLVCFTLVPSFAFSKEKKVNFKLGALINLTGHEAGQQVGNEQGMTDAIAWANRHNYIPGATLSMDWVDSGTSQAKGIEGYIKLMAGRTKPICWVGTNTGIGEALRERTARDKIVALEGGISRKLVSPPAWTFCQNLLFDEQAASAIDWFLGRWDKPAPPKMAILTWDNAYGRAHYTPQLEKYAQDKGVKIVSKQYVPTTPVEVKSQLIQIRDSGADFTFGGMYPEPWAIVLKDANSLGLIGKIQFISSWATNSIDVLRLTGPLSEGFAITITLSEPEEWGGRAIERIFSEVNRPEKSKTNFYAIGVQAVAIVSEGIRIAANKYGLENVDQQAFYNALQLMKNFDPWGATPPVTYSETKRYGLDRVKVLVIKDGKRVIPERYIKAPIL